MLYGTQGVAQWSCNPVLLNQDISRILQAIVCEPHHATYHANRMTQVAVTHGLEPSYSSLMLDASGACKVVRATSPGTLCKLYDTAMDMFCTIM